MLTRTLALLLALAASAFGQTVSNGEQVLSYSSNLTLNPNYTAAYITLTGNVTSISVPAGRFGGQTFHVTLCQGAGGPYTAAGSWSNTTGVTALGTTGCTRFRLEWDDPAGLWISTIEGQAASSSPTASAPLVVTGNNLSLPVATSSAAGYLASSDWATFNAKQQALTLTTTGTSGSATLSGGALNIPSYAGSVTTLSSGNLSPLFTTNVATPASTPALTFSLSNASQNSFLAGPATGGAGAPSYRSIVAADVPTLNQSTTGNAATASALAATPAQAATNQYCTGIAANGNCNSAQVQYSQLGGTEPTCPGCVASASTPLVITSNNIALPQATSSAAGYLASADWTTFNAKQQALTLTTTGTSGAASLSGAVLNIPTYTGGINTGTAYSVPYYASGGATVSAVSGTGVPVFTTSAAPTFTPLGGTGAALVTGPTTSTSGGIAYASSTNGTLAYATGITTTNIVTNSANNSFSSYQTMQKTLNFTVGSSIASASTIAPITGVFHVTGTAAITTITAPAGMSSTIGGCINLIPDGLWTTGTSGNIALASTAVVSKVLTMCYDGTKWYPSY